MPVPSEIGAYQDYYTQFAAALRGAAEFPVPATEAVHTLEVLDAARTSAEENRVVELSDSGSPTMIFIYFVGSVRRARSAPRTHQSSLVPVRQAAEPAELWTSSTS